jgi:hypothetical protein
LSMLASNHDPSKEIGLQVWATTSSDSALYFCWLCLLFLVSLCFVTLNFYFFTTLYLEIL